MMIQRILVMLTNNVIKCFLSKRGNRAINYPLAVTRELLIVFIVMSRKWHHLRLSLGKGCGLFKERISSDYGGPEGQNTTPSRHISEHTATFEKTQWHFRSPERKHELIKTKVSVRGMKESRRLEQEMALNWVLSSTKKGCLTFSVISNVFSNIVSEILFYEILCFLKCSFPLKCCVFSIFYFFCYEHSTNTTIFPYP